MSSFRIAVYVTAHTVEKLTKGEIAYDKAVKLLDRLGVEKVYLENYRSGLLVSRDLIVSLKERLEKRYEVAGGSCIGTWGKGWGRFVDLGFKTICLTDPLNLELTAKAIKQAGDVFSEVLIDDFWANWCTCSNCVSLFNEKYGIELSSEQLRSYLAGGDNPISRMWAVFSTDLLADVSIQYVIKPFKEQGSKLVLKVAEWREDFYVRGLFIPRLAELFDGFYVGTESREGTYRFGAYFTARLVSELSGKVEGVWFDTYDGLGPHPLSLETYLEQLLVSAAFLPSEITLFNLRDLLHPSRRQHVKALSDTLPSLRKGFREVKGKPVGMFSVAFQPPFSPVLDRYVEDYLGNIGFPLIPRKPSSLNKKCYILVTAKDVRSIDLEQLAKKVKGIVLTSGAIIELLKGAAGRIGYEVVGASGKGSLVSEAAVATWFEYEGIKARGGHRKNVLFPVGPVVDVSDVKPVLIAGNAHDKWPVVFKRSWRRVEVVALCVTLFPEYLFAYPEIVRQALRDVAAAVTGVRLSPKWGTLTNFSAYLYDDGHMMLANHNNHWIAVKVGLPRETTPTLMAGNGALELAKDGFTVEIPPRCYALLRLKENPFLS